VAQTLSCMSATPLYWCALRTYSAGHEVDALFVNTGRAGDGGATYRDADINGDVWATRGLTDHVWTLAELLSKVEQQQDAVNTPTVE
jgi:hypothetical protein